LASMLMVEAWGTAPQSGSSIPNASTTKQYI